MALSTSRRCTQKPSRPASWITTTLTARPSRRSAVSRSLPSSASSPGPSPALTTRFEIRSSPGELVATSQDLRLSSSAANTVLSSGRVAVATGWAKSVQDSLHECDWATAFYQIGCRPHRHGICLTMQYYGRLEHRHAERGGTERVRRRLQHSWRAVQDYGSGG